MMNDVNLRHLRVLQTAVFDTLKPVVHLRGKIGETSSFQRRVAEYNHKEDSGMSTHILFIP